MRNKNIVAAMLWIVNAPQFEHIKSIHIKYFESGHSHMECDSMHFLIERTQKHQKIYSPNKYALLFELARLKPRPYVVHRMKYTDFYNFEDLSKTFIQNRAVDENGETVRWLFIREFEFRRGSPTQVYFKYDVHNCTRFQDS